MKQKDDPQAVLDAVRERRAKAIGDARFYGKPVNAQRELDRVNADLDALLDAIPGLLAATEDRMLRSIVDETIDDKLQRYVAARGLVWKTHRRNGRKVCEEATELAIELAAKNWANARLELADVIFAAARQAQLMGTTVEACIEEKIVHDTGRSAREAAAAASADETATPPPVTPEAC